jgi:hypothetical protein
VADVLLPTDQPTGLHDVGLAVEARDVATEARGSAADAGRGADACIPIACYDPICSFNYCGKIGDGCGGTLESQIDQADHYAGANP